MEKLVNGANGVNLLAKRVVGVEYNERVRILSSRVEKMGKLSEAK